MTHMVHGMRAGVAGCGVGWYSLASFCARGLCHSYDQNLIAVVMKMRVLVVQPPPVGGERTKCLVCPWGYDWCLSSQLFSQDRKQGKARKPCRTYRGAQTRQVNVQS